MPVTASCPACGSPLSETSVLALAPVCNHCGSVITNVGGTLGLTGVYGVGDKTITRRRVEADLRILQEYEMKYSGMKVACIQQLDWGVERYANLPQPPALLTLQPVPELLGEHAALTFLVLLPFGLVLFGVPGLVVAWIVSLFSEYWGLIAYVLVFVMCLVICALMIGERVFPHFRAVKANGERPRENARRTQTYQEACAAAMKAAEPIKAAQDYRLRIQIRELESQAKMIMEKEKDVRCLLATLQ